MKRDILYVDDEPSNLIVFEAAFEEQFNVITCRSAEEALSYLAQHPVPVVVADQRMPEMTGVDLLSRARGECPEAVRIIFTGYADIKAVVDAVNRGEIYRYLTKPWDPDELAAVLRRACEHYEVLAERYRGVQAARNTSASAVGKRPAARQNKGAVIEPQY